MPIYKQFLTILFLVLFTSCNDQTHISGNIDYLGDSELILKQIPVHYKYAPVVQDTLSVNPEGNFNYSTTVDSTEIRLLVIEDAEYPLYLKSGKIHEIALNRS